MPTGLGIKTRGGQGMMLLKANLLIGLFLHITIDNLSTVMSQKRRRSLYLPIIGLQEVVAGMFETLTGMVETSG